ncbi:MAG: mycothiol system anti-sigma-R factor [Acidimicrobiia bacterium]|nr:mycothiol system anti-sigma-R factor [Acidimicrobiia bacterium]
MTGCRNAIEQIYPFLDSEMGRWKATKVKWHLRRCRGCAGAYEFEDHLKEVIREKGGGDDIPPELLDRLRALIREESAE